MELTALMAFASFSVA